MTITTYLSQKLVCIDQFAGTIRDPLSSALLTSAVVLKVLVLYVVTSPHYKHIGLGGGGGGGGK